MSKNTVFLSLKMDFVLESSVESDEVPHNVVFHLGLRRFSKVYQFTKG